MQKEQLVKEIRVLTSAESSAVRNEVHSLRSAWDDDRHRLGAGISYYRPQALYYATVKRMNPVLQKHFGWMYDRLLVAFEKHFGVSATFRDDLALPGFNIYCGPTDFSNIQYNIHIDLQFMELNWDPKGSTDFGTTMSFTLPIAAPLTGAGLNIWNVTQGDIAEADLERSKLLDVETAIYQEYNIGVATIHDGRHYHQMTVTENWLPTDERITLQGHGLMQHGKLTLYG